MQHRYDFDLVCFRLLDTLPDFSGDSLVDLPKDAQPAEQEGSGSDTDKGVKSKARDYRLSWL